MCVSISHHFRQPSGPPYYTQTLLLPSPFNACVRCSTPPAKQQQITSAVNKKKRRFFRLTEIWRRPRSRLRRTRLLVRLVPFALNAYHRQYWRLIILGKNLKLIYLLGCCASRRRPGKSRNFSPKSWWCSVEGRAGRRTIPAVAGVIRRRRQRRPPPRIRRQNEKSPTGCRRRRQRPNSSDGGGGDGQSGGDETARSGGGGRTRPTRKMSP